MLFISKFKHCILDFDGVIIDSEKKKFNDLQETLKKYDFVLKNDCFLDFIGKKRAYFIKELNNEKLNLHLNEIMGEIHKKDFDFQKYKLIPGLIKFLEFLKNKDIRVHIATGSNEKFVVEISEFFWHKKIFYLYNNG